MIPDFNFLHVLAFLSFCGCGALFLSFLHYLNNTKDNRKTIELKRLAYHGYFFLLIFFGLFLEHAGWAEIRAENTQGVSTCVNDDSAELEVIDGGDRIFFGGSYDGECGRQFLETDDGNN